jgi:hypothetical protein
VFFQSKVKTDLEFCDLRGTRNRREERKERKTNSVLVSLINKSIRAGEKEVFEIPKQSYKYTSIEAPSFTFKSSSTFAQLASASTFISTLATRFSITTKLSFFSFLSSKPIKTVCGS